MSALLDAVKNGDVGEVTRLIEEGTADVNQEDNTNGSTALHVASRDGHAKVVEILLKAKARVNEEDNEGNTPLHYAAANGRVDVASLLLSAGADVDCGYWEYGRTPLMLAARCGRPETVPLLLEKGASIDVDFEGKTALDMAKKPPSDITRGQGHDDVATLLQGWLDKLSLYYAAKAGDVKKVEQLIRAGADIAQRGDYGRTPLYEAAVNGYDKVVSILVAAGAEVDSESNGGSPPLYEAAVRGHDKVVSILVAAGAEVDSKDNDGSTPLHGAVVFGNDKVVSILVGAGAEVDSKDNYGRTPLHEAARSGYDKVVSILLAAGAEVDSKDDDGYTPLASIADMEGYLGDHPAMPLLLAAGADIEIKNKGGKSVMDIAKENGLDEMVKLLEGWSSKTSKTKAVNDSSTGGIDRLGYKYYAQAIFSVLSKCDTPLCVGLYGRWGSGKSFLVELLKREFDKDIKSNDTTKQLQQKFEYDRANEPKSFGADLSAAVADLHVGFKLMKENIQTLFIDQKLWEFQSKWSSLLSVGLLCHDIPFQVYMEFLILIYAVQYLFINRKDIYSWILWVLCKCKVFVRGIWPYAFAAHVDIVMDIKNAFLVERSQSSFEPAPVSVARQEKVIVEYVVVDFNAWEFCATDELWAGMIRAMYEKVEKRFEYEARRAGGTKEDFKVKWRTTTAKKKLIEAYGGERNLQLFVLLATFSLIVLNIAFFMYILGIIQLPKMDKYENYLVTAFLSSISYFWGNSIFQSAQVSRGDEIFSKAEAVKDKIGLMKDVRDELSSLFEFINKDFKEGTSIQLKLVLFIDDLDRCLGGRNVKMLEAVHLLLNVPGAPVITFLAIDSRVVIASIEEYIGVGDGLPTGGEYLRKIVQITFCIPEVTDERIQRYVKHVVKKNITIDAIKNLILLLEIHYKKLLSQIQVATNFPDGFELWCRFPKSNFEGRWIGGTCMKAQLLFEAIDVSDPMKSLKKLSGKLNFGRGLNGKSVFAEYGDLEGEEVFLQQAEQLFKNVKFFCSNATTISDTEQFSNMSGPNIVPPNQEIQEIEWGQQEDETAKDTYIDARCDKVIEIPDEHNSIQFAGMSSNTVLPENICLVLNEVVKLVNCNPRDMKRVINLLQIIFVLGNIKPRGGPIAFSKDKGLEWSSFLEKCVLWIILCQNFPYRMSLLVQVLLDFDQKQSFNANSKKLLTGIRVVYRNNTAENSQPELDDEMSIYAFYMTYVDKFVKAFKKSDRFCRLDNDPEEFAALLQCTAQKTTTTDIAIKCADVLGPREKSKETKVELKTTSVSTSSVPDAKEAAAEYEDQEVRDSTFSLLSYSFNLDPAMRIEIGEEIASVVSDYELYEEVNGKPISLQKGAVPRKIDILTAVSNQDQTYNYNLPVHGSNTVSTVPRSEEEIKNIIFAAIPIVSARDKIMAWLGQQCLLSEPFLYKVVPLQQCPNDWPLGWKLSLETAIDKLKNSGGP